MEKLSTLCNKLKSNLIKKKSFISFNNKAQIIMIRIINTTLTTIKSYGEDLIFVKIDNSSERKEYSD